MNALTEPNRIIPVVFLVNDAGQDFSKLKEYGTIVPLSLGKLNILDFPGITKMFREKLDHSIHTDYLAVSGHAVLSSIASCIMQHRHGVVNFLIFGSRYEDYCYREYRVG